MRHNYTSQTVFDNTRRQIEALNSNNRRLQKKVKIPTVPAYRGENFPDSATYGQLVTDRENNGMMWIYAEDDKWHPVGGFPRVRGTKKWGNIPTYSNGGPPGPFWGTGEEILVFDEDEIYINDPSTFHWIWDSFQWPPGFPDKLFIIQRGGVYCASYRMFIEHTGDGLHPPWVSCSGQTQMYEPDFEAWTGYERYHRQMAGSIVTDYVTYVLPYDLTLNYWTGYSGSTQNRLPDGSPDIIGGIEEYMTWWLWGIDDDPDYGNEFETSFAIAKPGGGPNGWFQGTYFEIIRLGDCDIMDHYDYAYEGINSFHPYPPTTPYPPAEETDMPEAPVIEGMEMHGNPSEYISEYDAPVLAAVQQSNSPTVQKINRPNRPRNRRPDQRRRGGLSLEDKPDAENRVSVMRRLARDGS